MTKEWYQDWFDTNYYHLLYQDRDASEAAAFIDRLVEHLQPKDEASMLDLACGKGRHAIQLARKGYDVTGLDLSFASIEAARHFENEKLHFFRHDMRRVFRTNYFDYVFNFFTSFGYFKNQRENGLAIETMSKALKPGGVLVIDYLNPLQTYRELKPHEIIERDEIKFEISRYEDELFFYKKIKVHDQAQQDTLEYEEKVGKITRAAFEVLFEEHQLKLTSVFGDYQFSPFEETTSPRMIMIATK